MFDRYLDEFNFFKSYFNDKNRKWMAHSIYVAVLAYFITLKTNKDPELACVCGLLHDVGRIESNSYMRHTIVGYKLISPINKKAAIVCLTHSFPTQNINHYQGTKNCTNEELHFLREFLMDYDYDYYDKLIQLCDAISGSDGFCRIEERLQDVLSRTGEKAFTQFLHRAYFALKYEFDYLLNCNIYDIAFSQNIIQYCKFLENNLKISILSE